MSIRRLSLVPLLLLFVTTAAFAQEDWHKSYPITGRPEFRFNTGDANLSITSWDRKVIDVHVTTYNWRFGERGLAVREHQTGDLVEIDIPTSDHGMHINIGWEPSRRVNVEVKMPREGRLNIFTRDGRVEARDLKGEFDIRTGDGRQVLTALDGALAAQSGDGRIEVSGRFDRLDLHSGDGRIEARVDLGSKVTDSWRLRAGDGSIHLRLPKDLSADLELHTGDGHIDFDFPITISGRQRGHDIRGQMNGGGQLLIIRTGDGSIRVETL